MKNLKAEYENLVRVLTLGRFRILLWQPTIRICLAAVTISINAFSFIPMTRFQYNQDFTPIDLWNNSCFFPNKSTIWKEHAR
jgi:hypothetical protein